MSTVPWYGEATGATLFALNICVISCPAHEQRIVVRKMRLTVVEMLALAALATGVLLAAMYPNRPDSPPGWICLAVTAVPVVLGLEYLGTKVLGSGVMDRVGRAGRLILGVLFLGALFALSFRVMTYCRR